MVQFQNFQLWVINVDQMDSPNTKNQPNDWYVQNWHTPFLPILAILDHLNQVPESRNCLVYWLLDIKPHGMDYPALKNFKLHHFWQKYGRFSFLGVFSLVKLLYKLQTSGCELSEGVGKN